MKRFGFLFLLLATNPIFAMHADTVKFYSAHGVVQRIVPAENSITIKHDKIAGYMMGMTMDFSVKATNELAQISAGDEINFTLAVDETESWITNLQLVAHHVVATNNALVFHADSLELKPGDTLPDGELTAEDGSRIHFSNFRGRAVAFTFFFTRCPLPDFCPRMNRNFFEARNILLANPKAPANWEFLSISFDPANDLPETLTNYAHFYRGENTNGWRFAAAPTNTLAVLAPRLDLMISRQGENISHNLRTVVLDPNGKIFRQFDGNTWTPTQLADAICAAAKIPKS
jgi:protein SCO1/2